MSLEIFMIAWSFDRGGVNGELFLPSYFNASYFGELFLCKLDYLKWWIFILLRLNYHPIYDFKHPNEPEVNLQRNITRHTDADVRKEI